MNGFIELDATFSGNSIVIDTNGQMNLHLHNFNEDYVMTFPSMCIKGLLHGELVQEYIGMYMFMYVCMYVCMYVHMVWNALPLSLFY